MARPVAADHRAKSRAILKAAARLFAQEGFDRASMSGIALACGVSKALLYHYHASKDHLLFDIIRAHLDDLVAAVQGVPEALPPRERLAAMIDALLEAYRHADDEHQIQISDMKRLPEAMRAELVARERVLVQAFSGALGALQPALRERRALLTPLTMNLFGMMNWKFMWFREGGAIGHAEFAEMVTRSIEAAAAELAGEAAREPRAGRLAAAIRAQG